MTGGGEGGVVAAAGCAPLEIGGQPADSVGAEGRVCE